MHPSGYSFNLKKHAVSGTYTLAGLDPHATCCHNPCIVSGGSKPEICKSMEYASKTCNGFVGGFANDKKKQQEIFDKIGQRLGEDVFSNHITLETVISLCCPGNECDAAWNKWLTGIEDCFCTIAFAIKRHYKASWGKDWQTHFHVEVVNGTLGNELLIVTAGQDRRKDLQVAFKLQMEYDNSVFTVARFQIPERCRISQCG